MVAAWIEIWRSGNFWPRLTTAAMPAPRDGCCGRPLSDGVASTGQDGAYLAEFLLGKGYVVHGIKRRSSSFNTERVDHLYQDPHERNVRFTLHYGDMTDATNLIRIIQETPANRNL